MSEHITHIAVYEDSVRIIRNCPKRFHEAFPTALKKAYDCGFFCSGSRGNHLYAVPILEKTKRIFISGGMTDKNWEQLAGAMGWITHRASDLQMKPLFRQVEKMGNPILTESECEMYHDAISCKYVFGGGSHSAGSPFERISQATLTENMATNPAAGYFHVAWTEELFTHYFMLGMLQQCVFTEKNSGIEEYAERIIEQSQDLYEDLRKYIRAYQKPEPYKMQGYINNFNVYDENDPLLRFVRHVQKYDEPHPGIDLEQALEQAEKGSQYAQALRLSFDFLGAASDYFGGQITKPEVYDALHIFHEDHRI